MLVDATKWRLRYSQLFVAKNKQPIPAFDVVRTFTKSPLLVACESQDARSSWYFAGYLTVYSDFGVVDRVQVAKQRLGINRCLLIDLPKPENGLIYKLNISPAPWHTEFSATIWEYLG